jgi:hypothetical protein
MQATRIWVTCAVFTNKCQLATLGGLLDKEGVGLVLTAPLMPRLAFLCQVWFCPLTHSPVNPVQLGTDGSWVALQGNTEL